MKTKKITKGIKLKTVKLDALRKFLVAHSKICNVV